MNEHEKSLFVARMTPCVCGHPAIEHYDSYAHCTWTMADPPECECEKFEAAELEYWTVVGEETTIETTEMEILE